MSILGGDIISSFFNILTMFVVCLLILRNVSSCIKATSNIPWHQVLACFTLESKIARMCGLYSQSKTCGSWILLIRMGTVSNRCKRICGHRKHFKPQNIRQKYFYIYFLMSCFGGIKSTFSHGSVAWNVTWAAYIFSSVPKGSHRIQR